MSRSLSHSADTQAASPGLQIENASEGQVSLIAVPAPNLGLGMSSSQIEVTIHGLLAREGDIFAFRRQSLLRANPFRAQIEFADTDVVNAIKSKFNGASLAVSELLRFSCFRTSPLNLAQGIQLFFAPTQAEAAKSGHDTPAGNTPVRATVNDITNIFQGLSVSSTPQAANSLAATALQGQSPLGLHPPQHQVAMYPVVYHNHVPGQTNYVLDQTPTRQAIPSFTPLTPLSSSMPLMGPIFTPPATPMTVPSNFTSPRSLSAYARQDSRRQDAMRVNRSPYYNAAGHHNHVDVSRIRDGIDVRTTASSSTILWKYPGLLIV